MSLRGVERRSPRILIGVDAYQIDVFQRVRPATYWKAILRLFGEGPTVREKS